MEEVSTELLNVNENYVNGYYGVIVHENTVFQNGVCIKVARVKPIYKTGFKANINNYRSTSAPKTFSKIIEYLKKRLLVYKQIC